MPESREALHKAAEARAAKYHIAFKEGGHLTPPANYPTDESQYGDPVNFRYPCDDSRKVAAITRYNDSANRTKGGYSTEEWAVIGRRIAKLVGDGHSLKDGKIVKREAATDEAIADAVQILDEPTPDDPSRPFRFRLPVMRANVVNVNRRLYPRELVAQALVDADRRAKQGEMLAESPHPKWVRGADGQIHFQTNYANTVARVIGAMMDAAGVVYADYELVDGNPLAATIRGIVKTGAKLGSSLRAIGDTVTKELNGQHVAVAKTLDIRTWDLVPNPATADALGVPIPLTDSEIAALPDPVADPEPNPAPQGDVPPVPESATLDSILDQNPAIKAELEARLKAAGEAAAKPLQDAIADRDRKEAAEKAKAEAVAFVDAEVVKLDRFPEAVRQAIATSAKTAPTQEQAKAILDAEVAQADRLAAGLGTQRLGFTGDPGSPGGTASTQVPAKVNEPSPYLDSANALRDALEDYAHGQGYSPDTKLRAINAPRVKKILDAFDKAHARAIADEIQFRRAFADSVAQGRPLTDAVTTATVVNQPSVVRTIIEQQFQELQGLQLVEEGVFEGQTAYIPVETYTRESTAATNLQVAEGGIVGRARVNLSYLPVAGQYRKLATVISREVEEMMRSGPLHYQAIARALFHVGYDMRRQLDLDIHNEHLQAADEYGCVAVTGESIAWNAASQVLVDAATNQTYLLPLKGGAANTPNTYIPLVRPRTSTYLTSNGPNTVTTNAITASNGSNLTIGSFTADGIVTGGDCAIDYENGRIYLAAGSVLTSGNYTLAYSYATNLALFSTAVPDSAPYNAQPQEWYWNNLVHTIGQQKTKMGEAPVFYTPNFGVCSLATGELLSQAIMTMGLFKQAGTDVDQDGFIAYVKGIPFIGINAPWNAGDSRILLGQRGAQKFFIGQPLQIDGPYEVRDQSTLQLTDEKEFLATTMVAQKTPVPARLRTIKLY